MGGGGGAGNLDVELLEALLDVEAVQQHLTGGHDGLRHPQQDAPLLDQLAAVDLELRLYVPGHPISPASHSI